MKLVGAAYLLWLAYRHFGGGGSAEDRQTPPKARAMMGLSAFWATVVKVEVTDLVFAVDSILVAVAMSQKTWVVLTGGILGIIAMRLVIGKLLRLIERYPALVDGAFIIIACVAAKLIVEYLHGAGLVAFEIPQWLSLGLIVAIFIAAFLWAQGEERKKRTKREEAARELFDEDVN